MKELYFMIALSGFGTALTIVSLILMIVLVFLGIGILTDSDFDEGGRKWAKRMLRLAIIPAVVFMLSFLIPNKKEMYLIYGLGGTIDYIKDSESAKAIPDNVLRYLEQWSESLTDKGDK